MSFISFLTLIILQNSSCTKLNEILVYKSMREISSPSKIDYKKAIAGSNCNLKLDIGITEILMKSPDCDTCSMWFAFSKNVKISSLKNIFQTSDKLSIIGYKILFEGKEYYLATEIKELPKNRP